MAGGGITMTVRDSGVLKILKEYVVELEVGILPEDADTRHEESGMTLAEVALVHEIGAGPIPARMPIRGWFADKRNAAVKELYAEANKGKR